MALAVRTCFGLVLVALAAGAVTSVTEGVEGSCRADGGCLSKGSALVQMTTPALSQVKLHPDGLDDVDVQPPSFSEVGASGTINVVSYNLYWWNVKQNNRWSALYSRIRGERPFDLIGFQECEDVASVLRSSSLNGFDYYQGPKPNPAPLAWNAQVFTKIGGPGNKFIATDRWGNRHLTWVRLRHNPSGANIFFANTHGPLGNCGDTVGNNWVSGVFDNKRSGDTVFMTGDFNCGSGTPAMRLLKGRLTTAVDGGIDQILTDRGSKQSGGQRSGSPSDHPLIKGSFGVTGSGSSATPRRRRSRVNPPQQGNCQDGSGQCGAWAGAGECTKNPAYMDSNCKRSCNKCSGGGTASTPPTPSGCQDDNNDCGAWANAGECNRNPNYMNVNCKRSCNRCR